MYVPPWLNVQPSDFVGAAQGGAKIGAQLAATGTEANIARQRIASSDAQNSARISAENNLAQARLAQAAQEAEAARALREWEHAQSFQLARDKNTQDASQFEQSNALDLGRLTLGQNREKLLERQQTEREAAAKDKKNAPIFRTLENQLLQIDPTTGTATSLFTAPFRPANGSALDRLLAGATGTGTSSPTNAPLSPDLAKKFLKDNGGDRAKAEAAAKAAGYSW